MKTMSWIQVLAFCWCGCAQSDQLTPTSCLKDADCRVPLVCGHRGLCGDVPENTLAAFLKCEQAGVPMLEVDTRETADGEVVVMHDDTVDRTTDGEQRFPGRTSVDLLTLEEFKSLVITDEACLEDPGADPDRCHPPALSELFARTGDQTILFIDFKTGDPVRLASEVERAGAAARVILYDPSLQVLRDYREALAGGLVMPRAESPQDVAALMNEENRDLSLLWIHGDPEFIAQAHGLAQRGGIRLYVDGFGNVDPLLAGAEISEDPAARAEFERQAWEALDGMIMDGAMGFGTNFAHRYVEHLYPQGFGEP
jgi:glycerophosphoryl diester phosphodiesterase